MASPPADRQHDDTQHLNPHLAIPNRQDVNDIVSAAIAMYNDAAETGGNELEQMIAEYKSLARRFEEISHESKLWKRQF